MLKLKMTYLLVTLFCLAQSIVARDVLLEFKAAGFFPSNECVKSIYGKAGCLFGPEVTFQFCEEKNWYGFASVDFLKKDGNSVGFCTPTKMSIVPLALGLKYFFPFCYGDFYLGLAVEPLSLKTTNCSDYVAQTTSQWGCGGIAKVGAYFDLTHNLFIDVFVDYSFVNIGCQCLPDQVVSVKVCMSGAIVGAGFGYRFH